MVQTGLTKSRSELTHPPARRQAVEADNNDSISRDVTQAAFHLMAFTCTAIKMRDLIALQKGAALPVYLHFAFA